MPSSLVFLWWCHRRNTLPSLVVLKSSDHIKNNFQSTYHVEMNPNDQECFSLLEDSSETVKPPNHLRSAHSTVLVPPPPNRSIVLPLTVWRTSTALPHCPTCNQWLHLLQASLRAHWHLESKLLSRAHPTLSLSAKGRERGGGDSEEMHFFKKKS